MNNSFDKFKKTGKIEDYMKYRSEISKEFETKDKKKDENNRNSNKKS